MKNFRSNGKLLLTAEYVVLDGALALALPTKFGQTLTVSPNDFDTLNWKSFDANKKIWFEDSFKLEEITSKFSESRNDISETLLKILQTAKSLNPDFLNNNKGLSIETHLEFPRLWGLGTSSTLINNIANWAKVDAYNLLEKTFGGSGYDIACASNDNAITYQLINLENEISRVAQNDKRIITEVDFNPNFNEHLYFVYLNKKQNSRDGIATYKQQKVTTETILEISNITKSIIDCKTLNDFNFLIEKHEDIIAKTIKQTPIKERLFKDFKGSIKSLGAWGGDFVLVTSKENPNSYFKAKGYETILSFKEMIL